MANVRALERTLSEAKPKEKKNHSPVREQTKTPRLAFWSLGSLLLPLGLQMDIPARVFQKWEVSWSQTGQDGLSADRHSALLLSGLREVSLTLCCQCSATSHMWLPGTCHVAGGK